MKIRAGKQPRSPHKGVWTAVAVVFGDILDLLLVFGGLFALITSVFRKRPIPKS